MLVDKQYKVVVRSATAMLC